MQGREGVDPDDRLVGLEAIQAALTASAAGGGPNLKPIRSDRDLGAEARMAGGLHAEGAGGGFGVEEVLQNAPLKQSQLAGRGPLAVEVGGADVARVQAVVVDGEEGHRQALADGVLLAEADPIEHRAGVEEVAEGADQVQEGLGTEDAGVAAGLHRGVVQVADGALGGLVDAAGNVEVRGAVGQANGTGAARFAATLLSSCVEVDAGGGQLLLAAGPLAVEVDALAAALRQAVVGHGADGLVATEQVLLSGLELLEQFENALGLVQRLIQGGQGRCRQGREGRGLLGVAECCCIPGAGEGPLQSAR